LAKRWAEYLTLVSTALFIPFEIYEISAGVSAFKVIILAINVAIVVYLLVAKRLFGIRGGHRVEHERRHRLSGWGALEQATPGFEPSPDQSDAVPGPPLVGGTFSQARSTTA
jgi:hypothetical protein